ncbi:Distantly related to plant expansins [Mycena venus]|uniref:Distantly related to plant expansins n=1 Tax=Mycena venus TaxID=2733690 RepID=A0A8H7CZK2_9AGAR|nr:Distantly related to plant expansins [Mycena venus]
MLTLLSVLLVPAVLAHNISPAKRHGSSSLLPRDGSSRFTNYYAGENDVEGACGAWHQDSEWVVALPMVQWDGGSHCNEQVYITYNGMSATATIVDECEGCPWGALDFSQSLFGHFVGGVQNNNNVGQFYGTYVFGSGPSSGGGGGGGNNDDNGDDDDNKTTTTKAPPPPPPKTTTTSHTTTSTTHSTTTTTHSSTTTTHTSSSASPSSKSAASSTHTSASASASATPSASAGPENIQDFSQAVLNLAGLVVQAPHAA